MCCCSFIMYRFPWHMYVCSLLLVVKFNVNFIILWSEQLSSSDISQSLIAASIWLFPIVKSILLEPLLLWNVVLVLSSLIICNWLLARNSSSSFPLELVHTSCHVVERLLLSIASMSFAPLVNSTIFSIVMFPIVSL